MCVCARVLERKNKRQKEGGAAAELVASWGSGLLSPSCCGASRLHCSDATLSLHTGTALVTLNYGPLTLSPLTMAPHWPRSLFTTLYLHTGSALLTPHYLHTGSAL